MHIPLCDVHSQYATPPPPPPSHFLSSPCLWTDPVQHKRHTHAHTGTSRPYFDIFFIFKDKLFHFFASIVLPRAHLFSRPFLTPPSLSLFLYFVGFDSCRFFPSPPPWNGFSFSLLAEKSYWESDIYTVFSHQFLKMIILALNLL